MTIPPGLSFAGCISEVRGKIGSLPLDDDDILLLAFDEISRTTTYVEQAYGNKTSCTT